MECGVVNILTALSGIFLSHESLTVQLNTAV